MQSSRRSHTEMQQLKVAIAHHFKHFLLLPPIEKWNGKGGAIATISETLKLEVRQNHVIQRVFEDVLRCEEEGAVYTGKRKYSKWSDEKHLISSDSHEYQIIGNAMEDGHGFRATTDLVNDHR